MADTAMYFCDKCNRTMRGTEFYGSNNLEKYPEGKLHQCKKCLTMHVDNWDSSTYMWILEECDVPYIPEEWNKLMMTYAKDKSRVTGTTILGRYLSKMKLKQFKNYRWKDTEFLQEMAEKKLTETMRRSGYDEQQIAAAVQEGKIVVPEEPVFAPANYYTEDQQEEEVEELDLTDEDKTYLRLKWGKAYKPEEWVKLEQLYDEMMQSYDIQSAGHIDTLKLVCKTSLKCNQLIDFGDVEGFQKMSRVYDQLMKSGKFTAAQNKADSGEFVDSISALVEICEKDGFIPRYYTDQPNDRVDETLLDLKEYTHSLVTEEMNLGNLIENAVKEMAQQESKEEDEDVEDEILTLAEADALKDEDFVEYSEFLEKESDDDNNLIREGD